MIRDILEWLNWIDRRGRFDVWEAVVDIVIVVSIPLTMYLLIRVV